MTIHNVELRGGDRDRDRDDYQEPVDQIEFRFQLDLTRRRFVQVLGAGLLIIVSQPILASAQQTQPARDGRGRGARRAEPVPIAARLHIAKDGTITVMTGKVECGQGARAELTQAAAEELRVRVEQIKLIMADTSLVPDDGITAGSRTTPSSVPAVRAGAAATRELLVTIAAQQWNVDAANLDARDGMVIDPIGGKQISYGELASDKAATKSFAQMVPPDIAVRAVKEWKVLGKSVPRPDARSLVTGTHEFPSDIKRPGMLYAKILRPPSYGAKLIAIELPKSSPDVIIVRDDQFVGVAAANSFRAQVALNHIAATAKWETPPHPSSKELYAYLREHANLPGDDAGDRRANEFKQTYNVAYVQHVPMEPRAAVAEWSDGKLTVWTATQNPFGCRGEIAKAFGLPAERVRVIVPDFGGGFGGKHSGECAIEAARIAREAKRPISLRWTRTEEFTWAYFRPAAVIDIRAQLDGGRITAWHQLNINSGQQSLQTPYAIAGAKGEFAQSKPALRHGSYRALASSANTFARESAMDELAAIVSADPLEFRLRHLEDERLRNVLEAAAKRFRWSARLAERRPNVGVGIACGTDKGSVVATCVCVELDPAKKAIKLQHVSTAFECGAIMNPAGLINQVRGALVMGIGPALREQVRFEDGKVTNASLWEYEVPRFADVPTIDVELLNRTDLPSAGAGETPIIALAPAIANAVHHAAGMRIRQMPIQLT